MMTNDRLKNEYYILTQVFPPKQFKLTSNTLTIAIQTNSKRIYTVKIECENHPYDVPKVFITSPKPLIDRSGSPLLGASHSMHTLSSENGCTRICHYGSSQWHSNVSLLQVVTKVRVWLEVYETHLKTGYPLDRYLTSAPY